eukprot:15478962-Alexandrium_andersonii.AAC.1
MLERMQGRRTIWWKPARGPNSSPREPRTHHDRRAKATVSVTRPAKVGDPRASARGSGGNARINRG